MTALGCSGTDDSETVMRHVFLALTTLIVASGGNTAFAQYDCPGGQRPVPPAVAERMALPLCGFDATKLWAGNMCQLCDCGVIGMSQITGWYNARSSFPFPMPSLKLQIGFQQRALTVIPPRTRCYPAGAIFVEVERSCSFIPPQRKLVIAKAA